MSLNRLAFAILSAQEIVDKCLEVKGGRRLHRPFLLQHFDARTELHRITYTGGSSAMDDHVSSLDPII